MTHDDRDIERALRRALQQRADGITPHDRLEQIRAAAAEVGAHGERSRWLTTAAAAAVAAVLAGGAWGLSHETQPAPPLPAVTSTRTGLPQLPTRSTAPPSPAPSRTGTTRPAPVRTGPSVSSSAPAPGPEGTGSAQTTQPTGRRPGATGTTPSSPDGTTAPPPGHTTAATPRATTTATVPVYFVGSTGGADGMGLYRQFLHARVPVSASPAETVRAALEIALSPAGKVPGTAYLQPWRGVGVTDVAVGDAAIRVTLSRPGDAGSMTGDETRLAVQQLVWTAQAVVGRGNLPVTFAVADGSTALFGTYPTAATYRRPGETFQDLAPIWVTDPAPGATVSAGTPLTAHGQACVFEAAVSWQLRQGGAVVRSGPALASSACPARGTWQVDLGRLPRGTWTLRVFATSAADGSVAAQASSTFRVR